MASLVTHAQAPNTPAQLATGAWVSAAAAAMNSGTIEFDLTFGVAMSNAHFTGFSRNIFVANDAGGLWIELTDLKLYNQTGAVFTQSLVGTTAGAVARIKIALAPGANASTLTITQVSGTVGGTGTFNFTTSGTYYTTTNALGVGGFGGNSQWDINAQIGPITDGATGGKTASSGITATSSITTLYTPPWITAMPMRRAFPTDTGSVDGAPSYFDNALQGILDSDLLGPPAIAGDKTAASGVSATTSIATTGIRDVKRASGITATTSIATSGSGPVTVSLGSNNWTSQRFGLGGTPCRVTLASVTAGSTLVVWRGGKISDFATVPTTSVGAFVAIPNSEVELTNWAGYGSKMYILRNATSGTSVNIDCNVTSFDEHTVHVIEVLGGATIPSTAFTQVGNPGTATQTTGSITITRPTLIDLNWGGAGPVGSTSGGAGVGNHVVSAVVNLPGGGTAAMTNLGGHTFDDTNGYVQSQRFVYLATLSGTYSCTVSHAPTQGSSLSLGGISDVRTASAGIAATSSITTAGRRDVKRASAVNATSSISTAALTTKTRSSGVTATSSITTAGIRDIKRAASSTGTTSIATSGQVTRTRSAATSATTSITTAGRRDVKRSAAIAATSEIATVGQVTRMRASGVTATTSIATTGTKATTRTASAATSATSSITTAGKRDVMRSAGSTGTTSITTVGQITSGVVRSTGISATSSIATAGKRDVMRGAGSHHDKRSA
jgi:hypothetical protein